MGVDQLIDTFLELTIPEFLLNPCYIFDFEPLKLTAPPYFL